MIINKNRMKLVEEEAVRMTVDKIWFEVVTESDYFSCKKAVVVYITISLKYYHKRKIFFKILFSTETTKNGSKLDATNGWGMKYIYIILYITRIYTLFYTLFYAYSLTYASIHIYFTGILTQTFRLPHSDFRADTYLCSI